MSETIDRVARATAGGSDLGGYLAQKKPALLALKARAQEAGYAPTRLRARVSAEGRSGVRRIRIRDHQVLSDSPADFAGYDLGPSSPELALGALGSCLTHSYLIQAAAQDLPVTRLEVEVTGQMDARAGSPGFEDVPVYPHAIAYVVHIESPASDAAVRAVQAAVERTCPILNLLRGAPDVRGQVYHKHASVGVESQEGVG